MTCRLGQDARSVPSSTFGSWFIPGHPSPPVIVRRETGLSGPGVYTLSVGVVGEGEPGRYWRYRREQSGH